MMRKAIALAAGLVILALVNLTVLQRERLLADGRVVLLELAPVDPRSLMQGDYMALDFAVARAAGQSEAVESTTDGRIVLALDERGVARFVRRDDGTALAANEVRLRYRVRDDRVKLVTNAWFFEEGRGARFEQSRYGELRVAPDGEALLAAMRDASLERIEP